MRRRAGQAVGFALALLAVLGAAALAADAGSQQDPLVTLSYLSDTYLPDLLRQVDRELEERDTALARELAAQIDEMERELAAKYGAGGAVSGTAAVYTEVTLAEGQTLTGRTGCEVLLRSGGASCAADTAPGLVDLTSGGTLSGGGSLERNHLYLMPVDGRGVRAASGGATLLVRGEHTVA